MFPAIKKISELNQKKKKTFHIWQLQMEIDPTKYVVNNLLKKNNRVRWFEWKLKGNLSNKFLKNVYTAKK